MTELTHLNPRRPPRYLADTRVSYVSAASVCDKGPCKRLFLQIFATANVSDIATRLTTYQHNTIYVTMDRQLKRMRQEQVKND